MYADWVCWYCDRPIIHFPARVPVIWRMTLYTSWSSQCFQALMQYFVIRTISVIASEPGGSRWGIQPLPPSLTSNIASHRAGTVKWADQLQLNFPIIQTKPHLMSKESPNCQFFISFHLWDQPRALILNKQKVSEGAALTALDPCPGTDGRAALDTQQHHDSPPYHAVMRK